MSPNGENTVYRKVAAWISLHLHLKSNSDIPK